MSFHFERKHTHKKTQEVPLKHTHLHTWNTCQLIQDENLVYSVIIRLLYVVSSYCACKTIECNDNNNNCTMSIAPKSLIMQVQQQTKSFGVVINGDMQNTSLGHGTAEKVWWKSKHVLSF